MLEVEDRIRDIGHFKGIVTQSGAGTQMGGDSQSAPDLIGSIYIEMTDRRDRDVSGIELENLYREAIADLPGARAEVVPIENGPPVGKEIQLELSGEDLDLLFSEARRVRTYMEDVMTGLIDIDDTAPVPGIEWEITVDRAQAAIMGASMAEIGSAIQMMTNGVFMGVYRPDDSGRGSRYPPALSAGIPGAGPDRLDPHRHRERAGARQQFHYPRTQAPGQFDSARERQPRGLRARQPRAGNRGG